MPAASHPVSLANRHPRLLLPRAAVLRLFAVLEQAAARLAPTRSGSHSGLPAPVSHRQPPSALHPSPWALFPSGELSVVFLSDPDLARLHGEFLQDPTPTDVITFEGDRAAGLAGEICVSVDTAAREARARRADFATELTLYLVHGWLHLAGHDDLVPAKKRRMRAAERRALALLRRTRAIPRFRLRRRPGDALNRSRPYLPKDRS